MSLFGAFDKTKHLTELANPLVTAEGVLTPEQRKARVRAALQPTAGDSGTGTVQTTSTTSASEFTDGNTRVTRLTCSNFSLGNSGDNASLAIGALLYTLPAGDIMVEGVEIAGGLTAALSNTAQTPEVGLGTTVGTGAVAVLSTTMEDFVDGGAAGAIGGDTTAPDVAGGLFRKCNLSTSANVLLKSSGGKAHTVYLNAAVAWADVTAAAPVLFTGVVTIKWRKIN